MIPCSACNGKGTLHAKVCHIPMKVKVECPVCQGVKVDLDPPSYFYVWPEHAIQKEAADNHPGTRMIIKGTIYYDPSQDK